jgi:hypothetical protein
MFCKFCGKEIPDGGQCDCRASAANAANTAPNPGFNLDKDIPVQAQPSMQPNVQPNAQPGAGGVSITIDTGRIMAGFKDLLSKVFTQPVTLLQYAYNEAYEGSQYAFGILYVLLLFILPFLEFKVVLGKYSKDVHVAKISFFIMLTVLLCKLVIVLIPMIVQKQPFKKVLGLVCTATALNSVTRLALCLTIMLKLIVPSFFIFSLGVMISTAMDYEVFNVTFSGHNNKKFWFFMLAQFIIYIIIYVLSYNVTLASLNSSFSSLGNIFGGL